MTITYKDDPGAMDALLASRLDDVRASVKDHCGDSRALFDEVQALIARLQFRILRVPDDLREAAAELEAEVIEDFYDNLPV